MVYKEKDEIARDVWKIPQEPPLRGQTLATISLTTLF